ncbi:MAG: tetratricopeptide repeat protein [Synechococcales cyanobacterium K44_A2020_017]|nr:tetratricopeptide repeat protein [Synechococcales cyanobacterium K44_A2020_017]
MADQASIYISRKPAEDILEGLDAALQHPDQHPIIFHVWGIGGVGKSTLLEKLRQDRQDNATILRFSFGERPEEPETPLMVMEALVKKLDELRVPVWKRDLLVEDPFPKLWQQYRKTRYQLETQLSQGNSVTPEELRQVKSVLRHGVDLSEWLGMPKSVAVAGRVLADQGVDGATALLSVKDELVSLFNTHQATKGKRVVQELMLNPIAKLSDALMTSLQQRSQTSPVVLLLDTYEKAPDEIDSWVRRMLLDVREHLQAHPVRVLIAGRYCITERSEVWRKLQQDYTWMFARELRRFNPDQTNAYIDQGQLEAVGRREELYEATKGLPYYLNFIRQRHEQGQPLDLSQGNQAVERLLLQGMTDAQKQIIQLAACCRWIDKPMINYLIQQFNIDPETVLGTEDDCYTWLTQKTFVEVVQSRYRLDDVARDVFHQSFQRDDDTGFRQAHEVLANYFKSLSDREVPKTSAPPAKYENPTWRDLRSEYLYHLMFGRLEILKTQFISHLLEASYFWELSMVQSPYTTAMAEKGLSNTNYLIPYANYDFLRKIQPVAALGRILLQKPFGSPADYLQDFRLSASDIDPSIKLCLSQRDSLHDFAHFLALLCQAHHCSDDDRINYLMVAQKQAKRLIHPDHPSFSSDLFWSIGSDLHQLREYEEAIAAYDQALDIKPDDHEVLNNKGIALRQLGRYEEAIAFYDQALAIKPDDHKALHNKGYALGNLGRYEEAIAFYDQALDIKPDNHKVLYNKGVALDELGRYEEAIAAYDQSLKIKPNDHEVLSSKGNTLNELGRHEEAIAIYDLALGVKPDDHVTLNSKGNTLLYLEFHEEAIAAYDQSLKIKPNDHEVLISKGNALFNLGRYEEAIAVYDLALGVKPDDHVTLYGKGNALFYLEFYEAAIVAYDQCLAIKPNDHEVLKSKGDALFCLKCYEEAIVAYDLALDIEPNFYKALLGRGKIYLIQELPQEAQENFRAVLELDPQNVVATLGLISVRSQSGNEDAADIFSEFLDVLTSALSPKLLEQIKKLSGGLVQNQYARSLASVLGVGIEEFMSASEEMVRMVQSLQCGQIYVQARNAQQQGDYETAISLLNQVHEQVFDLEAFADHRHEFLCEKALCYFLHHAVDEALQLFAEALELSSEQSKLYVRENSEFDAVRDDPRFQAMLTD